MAIKDYYHLLMSRLYAYYRVMVNLPKFLLHPIEDFGLKQTLIIVKRAAESQYLRQYEHLLPCGCHGIGNKPTGINTHCEEHFQSIFRDILKED